MSDDLARELERVVDRLNSMPLERVSRLVDDCRALAQFLVDQTRVIAGHPPADADLPRLAPHGLGAMIAVTGRDYLDAANAAPGCDTRPVLERVTAFRRSLP